jgi:outer membrane protein assembly factor BamB
MGFLRIPYALPAVLLMALGGGCSSFRVERPFDGRESGGWTTEGGSIGRENCTADILEPPLRFAWEYDASAGFGPAPAIVSDSMLFVANLQGEVHAVRLPSGEGAGSRDFGPAALGSPAVSGDTLFVPLAGTGEGLVAYDLRAGAVLWKLHTGEVESSPLVLGSRLYVAALGGTLHCVDRMKGKILWSYSVPAREKQIRSSPASDGDRIFFGTDGGTLYALKADSGSLAWEMRTRAGIRAAPSVSGGRVFVGSLDSTLYALDAASGKRLWASPLAGPIFVPPATDGRNVYAGTSGGSIVCVSAERGEVLWKVAASGPVSGAPLVAGRVLYAACLEKTLYAIDTRRGSVLWQYTTDKRIESAPLLWHEYLFLFSEGRSVLALKAGGGIP